MSSEQEEILQTFKEESQEHMSVLEEQLLAIEGGNAGPDEINLAFRAIHTVKGGAGFLGLNKLSDLGHNMEDLLGKLRNQEIQSSDEVTQSLLDGFDRLSEMFEDLESSNLIDIDVEVSQLQHVLSKSLGTTTLVPQKKKETNRVNPFVDAEISEDMAHYWIVISIAKESQRLNVSGQEIINEIEKMGSIENSSPSPLQLDGVEEVQLLFKSVLTEDLLHASGYQFDVLEEMKVSSEEPEIEDGKQDENKVTKSKPSKGKKGKSDDIVRINFSHLSMLIDLAGELILSRNQFMQKLDHNLKQEFNILSLQISDLQDGLMKTRMQTFASVTSKFPRIVRDLAKKLNKKVELETVGDDIELDKNILEGVSAPFTHILRNSLDHGIESPDDRVKAGKPRAGKILITATQKAGFVHIEVTDDGKGIDGEKIKNIAIKKGLITKEEASNYDHKQAISLIYMPGFSTQEKVSDVSGRGVGMDVVKTDFEKLGGYVDLDSELGKGTKLTIKLPLSVAIIQSLIVRVEGQLFAIPRNTVSEVLRLSPEEQSRIENVSGSSVLRYRDKLLPIVRMANILNIKQTYTKDGKQFLDQRKQIGDRRNVDREEDSDQENENQLAEDRRKEHSTVCIVVIKIGIHQFGVIIDDISHQEETVVKNLNETIEDMKHFMGITILSTGVVCFIIDGQEFSHKANITFENHDIEKEEVGNHSREMESFLLFQGAKEEHFAIPSGLVSLCAIIKVKDMIWVKDKCFYKRPEGEYELIFLHDYLSVSEIHIKDYDELKIVIPKHVHSKMAIVCSAIESIQNFDSQINYVGKPSPGMLGSAIIDEKLINFIDIHVLENSIYQDLNNRGEDKAFNNKRALLAEDSPLFQKIVSGHLTHLGFDVTVANHGEQALVKLENDSNYDLIVSDIEMPIMNGYEFIHSVRQDDRFKHIPAVAVTSLESKEAKAKGMEAGFDDFLVKINRDVFVKSINQLLNKNES